MWSYMLPLAFAEFVTAMTDKSSPWLVVMSPEEVSTIATAFPRECDPKITNPRSIEPVSNEIHGPLLSRMANVVVQTSQNLLSVGF